MRSARWPFEGTAGCDLGFVTWSRQSGGVLWTLSVGVETPWLGLAEGLLSVLDKARGTVPPSEQPRDASPWQVFITRLRLCAPSSPSSLTCITLSLLLMMLLSSIVLIKQLFIYKALLIGAFCKNLNTSCSPWFAFTLVFWVCFLLSGNVRWTCVWLKQLAEEQVGTSVQPHCPVPCGHCTCNPVPLLPVKFHGFSPSLGT